MNPLLPTDPDELPALLMENELLRYEVAHLRSRLAGAIAAAGAVTPGEGDVSATEGPLGRSRAWLAGLRERRPDPGP